MKKAMSWANKLFCQKGVGIITAIALVVTTFSANSTCMYMMHQPELPKSAKKLRKF